MQISNSQHSTLGQLINCSNKQDETNLSLILQRQGGVGGGRTRLFIILLAHIHTLTHLIFVHSKIYLAKYLEMCNIVYRLWYNTFQFRSLSLKGIIICSLKTWKCYSFTRKHRWLEEVTRKSGPWKWKLSFILVHTGSLNLFVIATATLLPFTKPSNSQGENHACCLQQ